MSLGQNHKNFTATVLSMLPASLHSKVESWMEPAQLLPLGKRTGGGVLLAHYHYQTTVHIEELPFHLVDTTTLLAQAAAWVMEHDHHRQLLAEERRSIKVDSEVVDENKVDLDLSVQFVEVLTLVADPNGPVQLSGQRWRVEQPTEQVADSVQVVISHE